MGPGIISLMQVNIQPCLFIDTFGSSTKPATFEQAILQLDAVMKSFAKMKTEIAVAVQFHDLSIDCHQ